MLQRETQSTELAPRKTRAMRRRIVWGLLTFTLIPFVGGVYVVGAWLFGVDVLHLDARAAGTAPLLLHIFGSFVFCGLGAFQIASGLGYGGRPWHRKLGWIAWTGGALSATSGLWITLGLPISPETQGGVLYVTRAVVSLAMLFLMFQAIWSGQSRDYLAHGRAMLRTYALAQAASTQAWISLVWGIVLPIPLEGTVRDVMMLSAWLLNAAIAEWVIAKWMRPSHGLRPLQS